jgi:hypothetical protein
MQKNVPHRMRDSPSATEFTLGHNVSSKVEFGAVMEEAKSKRKNNQACRQYFLEWLCRLLSRPRWSFVGSDMESGAEGIGLR